MRTSHVVYRMLGLGVEIPPIAALHWPAVWVGRGMEGMVKE